MRLALLVLFAIPLFAQSEICRFRAGDGVDPFRRWLGSQELTCVAAGAAVEVPAGLWNLFARSGEGLSAPVIVEGATKVDAASFHSAAAGTLAVQLPEGHGGVVYVPRRAVAYPVSAHTTVPAGEELWLLVLKSRAVASIVTIPALEAGTGRAVDARTGALPPSVLGWLRVAEEDREAVRSAGSGVSSPQVRLTAGGPARDSDPLPPPVAMDGAFVLVRGVPAGEAELDISGRGWLPHRARVNVGSRSVTAVTSPLLVRPAASLLVSFSTGVDVMALDSSLGSCDPSKDKPPLFEISVFACPKPEVDPKECQMIRQETFSAEVPYGSFAVDDVAPGTYRAEMRFGKLPPASTMASVTGLQQAPMRLHAAYMTLYGSLTHGGEPFEHDAAIAFPGGGVGFASKETGEYRAVLLDRIIEPDARLDVIACDEGPRAYVLTDEFLKPFTRHDIDIPDNSITVHVTDTFTQMVLREATVKYVVMTKRQPFRPLITGTIRPGERPDGRFVLEAVPERQIQLTVSHGGYQKYAVEPFTMSKSEHKKIEVQLVPLRGNRGRIVSPVPFDDGFVFWHSASGRDETAELAPDGTFVYEGSHEPGTTIAVVSRSHPLWVLRMPAVAPRQSLDLRFPEAPVREFWVGIEGVDTRIVTPIGITIGNLLVSPGALPQHQRLRDSSSTIRGNRSVTFKDILETGPIEVFAGAVDSPHQRLGPGVTELILSPSTP